jgi:hypothetical protein
MRDADRDEFERWAEREGYRLMRAPESPHYGSELTEAACQAWCAARRAPPPQIPS